MCVLVHFFDFFSFCSSFFSFLSFFLSFFFLSFLLSFFLSFFLSNFLLSLQIKVGEWHLQSSEESEVDIPIAAIHIHSQYNIPQQFQNDIALIQLARPAPISECRYRWDSGSQTEYDEHCNENQNKFSTQVKGNLYCKIRLKSYT